MNAAGSGCHVSRERMREKIAADPDLPCEAGTFASPFLSPHRFYHARPATRKAPRWLRVLRVCMRKMGRAIVTAPTWPI